MNTKLTRLIGAAMIAAASITSAAHASQGLDQMDCGELWAERNAAYKSANYCFKTRKARQFFGNSPNCTNNPKLSRSDQNYVAAVQRVERRKGC